MLKIQEGNVSIPVDISQEPFAFPEPTDYMWLKDGQPLRNGLTKTYSNITFNSVLRTDSGIYTVFAANTLLNDTSQQIGNDSGSFHLNVLCKFAAQMLGFPSFSVAETPQKLQKFGRGFNDHKHHSLQPS